MKKASSVYSNSAYGQGSVVPFAGAVAVDLGTGRPASVYNGSTYAPYGYSNVPLQQFSNNGPSNRMSMVSIRPGFSSYPAIGNMMSPVNRFSLQAPTPQQPYTVKNASTSGSAGQQQHQLPADEDLLTAIKKILSTANLLTVTKKMVRDELSLIFQTDLSDKKALINTYIEDVLQGRR